MKAKNLGQMTHKLRLHLGHMGPRLNLDLGHMVLKLENLISF
jgi:hypothetical protein